MSLEMKWQYSEFFNKNREKLIQLLISEIIFLDHCIQKVNSKKGKRLVKKALKKFEKILEIEQEQIDCNLSDKDYYILITHIYQTIEKVINKFK